MLRERLGEHCAERGIGEHSAERDWANIVLRERLVKHSAEIEIGGSLC